MYGLHNVLPYIVSVFILRLHPGVLLGTGKLSAGVFCDRLTSHVEKGGGGHVYIFVQRDIEIVASFM